MAEHSDLIGRCKNVASLNNLNGCHPFMSEVVRYEVVRSEVFSSDTQTTIRSTDSEK